MEPDEASTHVLPPPSALVSPCRIERAYSATYDGCSATAEWRHRRLVGATPRSVVYRVDVKRVLLFAVLLILLADVSGVMARYLVRKRCVFEACRKRQRPPPSPGAAVISWGWAPYGRP